MGYEDLSRNFLYGGISLIFLHTRAARRRTPVGGPAGTAVSEHCGTPVWEHSGTPGTEHFCTAGEAHSGTLV